MASPSTPTMCNDGAKRKTPCFDEERVEGAQFNLITLSSQQLASSFVELQKRPLEREENATKKLKTDAECTIDKETAKEVSIDINEQSSYYRIKLQQEMGDLSLPNYKFKDFKEYATCPELAPDARKIGSYLNHTCLEYIGYPNEVEYSASVMFERPIIVGVYTDKTIRQMKRYFTKRKFKISHYDDRIALGAKSSEYDRYYKVRVSFRYDTPLCKSSAKVIVYNQKFNFESIVYSLKASIEAEYPALRLKNFQPQEGMMWFYWFVNLTHNSKLFTFRVCFRYSPSALPEVACHIECEDDDINAAEFAHCFRALTIYYQFQHQQYERKIKPIANLDQDILLLKKLKVHDKFIKTLQSLTICQHESTYDELRLHAAPTDPDLDYFDYKELELLEQREKCGDAKVLNRLDILPTSAPVIVTQTNDASTGTLIRKKNKDGDASVNNYEWLEFDDGVVTLYPLRLEKGKKEEEEELSDKTKQLVKYLGLAAMSTVLADKALQDIKCLDNFSSIETYLKHPKSEK